MTLQRLAPGTTASQAVIHRDIVYLAEQLGIPGESIADQTRTALRRIEALLAEAGSAKSHLLSATIRLADGADLEEVDAVWSEWLGSEEPPVRTVATAGPASPGHKVEIAVTAARRQVGLHLIHTDP